MSREMAKFQIAFIVIVYCIMLEQQLGECGDLDNCICPKEELKDGFAKCLDGMDDNLKKFAEDFYGADGLKWSNDGKTIVQYMCDDTEKYGDYPYTFLHPGYVEYYNDNTTYNLDKENIDKYGSCYYDLTAECYTEERR